MAVCLMVQFRGIDPAKYEAVLEKLGLTGANPDWAPGFVSHVMGFDGDTAHVVDVWDSRADFDQFVKDRLQPAFDMVGISAQPQIKSFEVHNTMRPRD